MLYKKDEYVFFHKLLLYIYMRSSFDGDEYVRSTPHCGDGLSRSQ